MFFDAYEDIQAKYGDAPICEEGRFAVVASTMSEDGSAMILTLLRDGAVFRMSRIQSAQDGHMVSAQAVEEIAQQILANTVKEFA